MPRQWCTHLCSSLRSREFYGDPRHRHISIGEFSQRLRLSSWLARRRHHCIGVSLGLVDSQSGKRRIRRDIAPRKGAVVSPRKLGLPGRAASSKFKFSSFAKTRIYCPDYLSIRVAALHMPSSPTPGSKLVRPCMTLWLLIAHRSPGFIGKTNLNASRSAVRAKAW